jgi:hypothetical protein
MGFSGTYWARSAKSFTRFKKEVAELYSENRALTDLLAFILTVQVGFFPTQAPLQPKNRLSA